MAAHHFEVSHAAIRSGRDAEAHVALNARLPGERRINRIDLAERLWTGRLRSLSELRRGARRHYASQRALRYEGRAASIQTERHGDIESTGCPRGEHPLLHRIERGRCEQRMPAYHFDIGHSAIRSGRRIQAYIALNARLLGECRINRIDFRNG